MDKSDNDRSHYVIYLNCQIVINKVPHDRIRHNSLGKPQELRTIHRDVSCNLVWKKEKMGRIGG